MRDPSRPAWSPLTRQPPGQGRAPEASFERVGSRGRGRRAASPILCDVAGDAGASVLVNLVLPRRRDRAHHAIGVTVRRNASPPSAPGNSAPPPRPASSYSVRTDLKSVLAHDRFGSPYPTRFAVATSRPGIRALAEGSPPAEPASCRSACLPDLDVRVEGPGPGRRIAISIPFPFRRHATPVVAATISDSWPQRPRIGCCRGADRLQKGGI